MYYEVITKCGHVGKGKYIEVSFPVIAQSKKEAARIARNIPRVKHDHKDAIREVREVTKERYEEIQRINRDDEYLKCNSIQEQRLIDGIESRIVEEEKGEEKEKMKDNVWKKKTLIRNYKKYIKFNIDMYEYAV